MYMFGTVLKTKRSNCRKTCLDYVHGVVCYTGRRMDTNKEEEGTSMRTVRAMRGMTARKEIEPLVRADALRLKGP